MLQSSKDYTMNYDGHIVENAKNDDAFTYKKTESYYRVVCGINKLPVYMQNRKGNTDGIPVTLRFADKIGEILTASTDIQAPPLAFKYYI